VGAARCRCWPLEATFDRPGDTAAAVVEQLLQDSNAFQYLAILHDDRVTGRRDGQRVFGQQIEVRCWDSVDARVAAPTPLPFAELQELATRITAAVPGVVSVTYRIATKPAATIEAV
jgi:GMP synthase (glutamine-hydrolysing)